MHTAQDTTYTPQNIEMAKEWQSSPMKSKNKEVICRFPNYHFVRGGGAHIQKTQSFYFKTYLFDLVFGSCCENNPLKT